MREFNERKKKSNFFKNILLTTIIIFVGITCYFAGGYFVKQSLVVAMTKSVEVQTEQKQESPIYVPILPTVSPDPVFNVPTVIATDNTNATAIKNEDYNIEIVKSSYKLYLKQGDQLIKQYDIAIGKNPGQKQRSGDWTTPTGNFYVEDIIDARQWTHDFKDGKGEINGAYGPWFISLETGWDGIGIHGTHDPNSIGTMVSEGCIRMNNPDVLELKTFVKLNTKVSIKE